eukprot:gb/GECH01009979.1/.p1 GENE.gb/GECH01009979.1/~~gb/GECH01009979.1/.p1  ORF type:complete len:867 (+),score=235.58 gb/GECH01009979.1/:1-2601(+)
MENLKNEDLSLEEFLSSLDKLKKKKRPDDTEEKNRVGFHVNNNVKKSESRFSHNTPSKKKSPSKTIRIKSPGKKENLIKEQSKDFPQDKLNFNISKQQKKTVPSSRRNSSNTLNNYNSESDNTLGLGPVIKAFESEDYDTFDSKREADFPSSEKNSSTPIKKINSKSRRKPTKRLHKQKTQKNRRSNEHNLSRNKKYSNTEKNSNKHTGHSTQQLSLNEFNLMMYVDENNSDSDSSSNVLSFADTDEGLELNEEEKEREDSVQKKDNKKGNRESPSSKQKDKQEHSLQCSSPSSYSNSVSKNVAHSESQNILTPERDNIDNYNILDNKSKEIINSLREFHSYLISQNKKSSHYQKNGIYHDVQLKKKVENLQQAIKSLNGHMMEQKQESERKQRQTEKEAENKIQRYREQYEERFKESKERLLSLRKMIDDYQYQKQKQVEDLKNELKDKNEEIKWLKTQRTKESSFSVSLDTQMVEIRGSLRTLFRNFKSLKKSHSNLAKDSRDSVKQLKYELESSFSKVIDKTTKIEKNEREFIKNVYTRIANERFRVFEKVQELQENTSVFCRVRPLLEKEIFEDQRFHPVIGDDNTLYLKVGPKKYSFRFDNIFRHNSSQQDVFLELAPYSIPVMNNKNVCLFIYGHQGSGKTHTLCGTPRNEGLGFMLMRELFKLRDVRKYDYDYTFDMSIFEVMNGEVVDILPQSESQNSGVNAVPVYSAAEVAEKLRLADDSQMLVSNGMEISHLVFKLTVTKQCRKTQKSTRNHLYLINLAAESFPSTMNSLDFGLKDVFESIVLNEKSIPSFSSHEQPPVLNSMLRDALSPSATTLFLVTISPTSHAINNTLTSLKFAQRIRNLRSGNRNQNKEEWD